MVHNGPIEDIIEVRDNGLPVLFTKNLPLGKFTLNRSPYGTITASVQGSKPSSYYNNIADIIQHIVTTYGPINTRLSPSDINTGSFTAFKLVNMQPVGIYCTGGDTVLDVCQKLASSIGAAIVFNGQGKLSLVKLDIPGSGITYSVTAEDMEFNSLSISDKPVVSSSIRLAYCKNWTPLTTTAGGLPSTHAPYYTKDWGNTVVNSSVASASTYNQAELPEPEETYLLTSTDATAELTRRLAVFGTNRLIVTATYFSHMLPIELGDSLHITHDRFGLENGKTGTVISVDRDWLSGRVVIGVIM
jgi:hypothetical protein